MWSNFCGVPIDWTATGTMMSGTAAYAAVGAVVWAANKGANTFNAWRAQKLAERKGDQAERILTATYKVRRALTRVRSPMVWAHELRAAEEVLKEKEGWNQQPEFRQKRLTTAQAYYDRINATQAERVELDECLPMARALFSEELEKAIDNLNRQFWIVQTYVDAYIDDNPDVIGHDLEFSAKIKYAMNDLTPPQGMTSEVTDAAKKAVDFIEATCLPVLRLESELKPKRRLWFTKVASPPSAESHQS